MVANVVLDPGGFRVNEVDRHDDGSAEYNVVLDDAEIGENYIDFLTPVAQSKLGWDHPSGKLEAPPFRNLYEDLMLVRCNDELMLTFDQIADLIEGGVIQHVKE